MNKNVKKRWLKAIRSGEFSQCKGVLHSKNDGGFCCLGVLCDIEIDGEWDDSVHDDMWYLYPDDGSKSLGYVPSAAHYAKWGLSTSQAQQLVGMNDGGESFEFIANWIEKNL